MFPFALSLLIALQAPQSGGQDQIKDTLARAESLYYEAKFTDAIQLLSQLNDSLQTRPDRLQDKINTKLQLGLAHIGMNNASVARLFFVEIYLLDPEFDLDAKQYSPKVLALANEAKAEQGKIRCLRAAEDAQKQLAGGDATALLNTLRSMKPKCADLASIEPAAAELVYRKGLHSYKDGDFSGALESFRSAVKLAPKHEMAAQYLELAESRLEVAEDRLMIDWQRNFEARRFPQAAANYRQILSVNNDAHSQTVAQVTGEYRKALSSLVDTWSRACSNNDAAKMAEARNQARELVPEPSFGEDVRSKMDSCVAPAAPQVVEPKIAAVIDSKADRMPDIPLPKAGCFQMEPALALSRLKTKVEPEISAQVRNFIQNQQVTVRVKTRIDENGNATVSDVAGSNAIVNNTVRAAVEKWKFVPAVDQNGPRCVLTEILFVLSK